MPLLFGLAGPAGAGRTTVAKHLWSQHGALILPYTGPLKAAAAQIFAFAPGAADDTETEDGQIEHWHMSRAQIYRELGEGVKRIFGREIWIKRWLMSYDAVKDTDDVVVPDLRYPLEAEILREVGGRILHVQRPGVQAPPSEPVLERAADDLLIENDGTLEQLYGRTDYIVDTMRRAGK